MYIVDIFVGQLKSTLTCLDCQHVSDTFEPFLALSLPLKKVFINDLRFHLVLLPLIIDHQVQSTFLASSVVSL